MDLAAGGGARSIRWMSGVTLVGRSSSHFTRVARIFALELGVAHELRVVRDILASDAALFGENPALKIPVLLDEHGPLFGAENICRELVRRAEAADAADAADAAPGEGSAGAGRVSAGKGGAGSRRAVVLRGAVADRVVANAEELTLHVMAAEVSLILAKVTGADAPPKVARSIEGSLAWLDAHVDEACAALPPARALSFLEVALHCLVEHLPFREIMTLERYPRLTTFSQAYAGRASARATTFRFDAA